MTASRVIKQTVQGARIISEWLGAGGETVPLSKADSRASVCQHCPHNVGGRWIDKLKSSAAGLIKEHLLVKDGLGISLSNEDKIGFCDKCGCSLTLKCWVPIEHVMIHTPQNQVLDYPDFCWIRKELTGL